MLLEDELSLNPSYANMANPLFLEKVLRNYKNAEAWCDIKQSDKIETCVELSKKSLTKSLRKLKEMYGSDVNNWRWGDERRINHPSFSVNGVLIPKFLQEISSEISGSKHTLNSIMLRDLSNYKVAKGSSFKMIIDFSAPTKNMFIIPSGQSGHLISRHYDDQTNLWKSGNYIYLSGVKDLILGGAKGEIIIHPLSIE